MPEQIYIGNFGKGLVTNREPFVIDNDSFPTMFNFYSWRGRAKKKRGTKFLGQLQLQEQIVTPPIPPATIPSWQLEGFNLVAGAENLITHYSLGTSASITPGSISLTIGGNVYTEPVPPDGSLLRNGLADPGSTINYATGAFTIAGGGASAVIGFFSYFPGLPVMGLRDFAYDTLPGLKPVPTIYPLTLAFDTKYAYQIRQTVMTKNFYDVSYYKQTNNPVIWSAQDYQLFWTTNYQGALWATNNKPGFSFKSLTNILGVSVTRISATQVTINITANGLVANDLIWINEVTGTIGTGSGATQNQNINGQTGYVVVTGANTVTVNFDGTMGSSLANFQVGATGSGGIAQYLTSGIAGQDGIRWYDGDPTSATGLPTTTVVGWVNFAPPLTATSVAIDDNPSALYYLVGALAILPFKDRLLFFSPWIQTSSGLPIQLQDTVLWSWRGTPYYSTIFPVGQTSDIKGYYQDQTGLGGNLPAGVPQPIKTIANNEDVLLIGFAGAGRKTRFVYTGDDLNPFLFFNINSELPSDSTFSAVTLDKGAIDIGVYGIAMTDQQSSYRIDLPIPDSVFQIQQLNNGVDRVNAIRDFFFEWIYFSYPVNTSDWRFPTQTFLFNYRDNTWAVHYENFTAHGNFRPQFKKSWLTTGFSSWDSWDEPWNSGLQSPLIANIIAGNPQGYVLIKGQGLDEATSGTIKAIANNGGGNTRFTSINHCVSENNDNINTGDYLYFSGFLGPISYNQAIGQVIATPTADTFDVDLPFDATAYLGLGKYSRLTQPLLQTKQFNPYWEQGRQARLSAQKYLMDMTPTGQVTVNIYLSQDPDTAWNDPITINPAPNSLVYSQLMYTCPESTNIGLTPANTNLQMPIALTQHQIWHRFNTSMIGDSFQIGITLSDAQMRNLVFATSEISLHGMHLSVDKSSQLA